jgi:plastocyanin
MRTIQILLATVAFLSLSAVSRADDVTILATAMRQWDKKETEVKVGDVVTWKIQGGLHGVMFNDFTEAEKVLKIEEGGLKIEKQPDYDLPAQGTEAVTGTGTILVKAKIIAIPEGVTSVTFFCTEHPMMTGKLVLKASTAPAAKVPKTEK